MKSSSLLVVRMGGVNKKIRRAHVERLPMLLDALDLCKDKDGAGGRAINLGSLHDCPVSRLELAAEWAATPAEDYVLPPREDAQREVRDALRFFGVEQQTVDNLRSAAQLRESLTKLKGIDSRLREVKIQSLLKTIDITSSERMKELAQEHVALLHQLGDLVAKL